jgi:hypothetical protein
MGDTVYLHEIERSVGNRIYRIGTGDTDSMGVGNTETRRLVNR